MRNDPFKEIVEGYQEVLRRVESAVRPDCDRLAWGVAGFREETLVALLGEHLRPEGWDIAYELSYPRPRRWRADLVARRKDLRLWIEAKWWWRGDSLANVLRLDEDRLDSVPDATPVALVFVPDRLDLAQGDHRWDTAGAGAWLHEVLRQEHLGDAWILRGAATVESCYFGTATGCDGVDWRSGLLAAAFFERRAPGVR